MEVRIDGIQQLTRALDGPARKQVLAAADRGLKQVGMNIIAEAQTNLRRERINTTGRLSQSGRVEKDKDGYDVGFMSGEENYASAVEFGRRAGRMPPVSDIRAWVQKKHSGAFNAARSAAAFLRKSTDAVLTSAAWAIAKSIGRHGTKPHPFFAPAVKKYESKALEIIGSAVNQETNRINV